MNIKRCERKEYTQMLAMVNAAFGKGGDTWFQDEMPHTTPYEPDASDEEIGRHFIAVEDGEVVGCVGAYPFELVCGYKNGAAPVKAFGIGQVSCKAEARGKGVMSGLLKAAIDYNVANGMHMGFLWGDRFRYGHFGFDFAGGKINLEVAVKRLPKPPEDFAVRKATEGDIELIRAIYGRFQARTERWESAWRRMVGFPSLFIGTAGGETAYMLARGEQRVVEIQGGVSAALGLLGHYAETAKKDEIGVEYPMSPRGDSLLDALKAHSGYISSDSVALCAFYRDGLKEKLAPSWDGAAEWSLWIPEADHV